jgi:hypothetical protein
LLRSGSWDKFARRIIFARPGERVMADVVLQLSVSVFGLTLFGVGLYYVFRR